MTALLDQPLWQASDLGWPLPPSAHATSVCLPTWADNVGYEEGEQRVIEKLQAGYPRFVYNRLVRRLMDRETEPGRVAVVLASEASADRCRQFLLAADIDCEIHSLRHDAWVVTVPVSAQARLKAFWQHTGEGISSRVAAELLGEAPVPSPADGEAARQEIQTRVSHHLNCDANACRLYPSGMAAIAAAWRIARAAHAGSGTVQFGFPYVDTLKLQEKFGNVVFLSRGDDNDYAAAEAACASGAVSAIFCEFPANPLLDSPDLARLAAACRPNGVLLIVDDTVATSVQVDVSHFADLITTSLTKAFSGVGDVMAGAVTVSPFSLDAERLRAALAADCAPPLAAADAIVLAANSRTYADRVHRMCNTAESLCDALRSHPAIADLRYPKWTGTQAYEICRRPDGGYGFLFSFVLHDAEKTTPPFFDRLQISKGPSLGTSFSLACPYTLLAHYHELPEVEACGVSRWLIRVSVGLESAEELIARFKEALPCHAG